MKAIKKVEVTPLDYNEGKIINSASTTDDKTKNTYSIKVIDEELETKSDVGHNHDDRYYTETESDAKYQLKNDFAVLTGSITLQPNKQQFLEIDYPTGFTQSNTFVISNMVDMQSGGYIQGYITGIVVNSSSYINNYLTGNTQPRIKLEANKIGLYFYNGSTENNATFDYKILLMKIDTEFTPSM